MSPFMWVRGSSWSERNLLSLVTCSPLLKEMIWKHFVEMDPQRVILLISSILGARAAYLDVQYSKTVLKTLARNNAGLWCLEVNCLPGALTGIYFQSKTRIDF